MKTVMKNKSVARRMFARAKNHRFYCREPFSKAQAESLRHIASIKRAASVH